MFRKKLALFRKTISVAVFAVSLFPFFSVEAVADYTLFARHPFDENKIIPDTVPSDGEKIQAGDKLTLFASRNEYESTTFAVYNPNSTLLNNVKVTISSLTNGQNAIDQQNIDIRVVKVIQKRNDRYNLSAGLSPNPEVLIPHTTDWINQGEFNVPAGKSKQWWITVKVNYDTPPGNLYGNDPN